MRAHKSPSFVLQVDTALLRESEELMEVRQELVRRNAEVDLQRGEVQRLQEELQKKDDEMSKAIRHKHCLRSHTNQLSHELEELHIKHQVTGSSPSVHCHLYWPSSL